MAQDAFGNVLCLDAKLNIDANSEFRQKEVSNMRDLTQVKDVRVFIVAHTVFTGEP